MQWNIKNIVLIVIKYLKRREISASNKQNKVDMPLSKAL